MYRIIINTLAGLTKRKRKENGVSDQPNHSTFYNYFLIPFYSGIAGFASFLFIVMLFEFIAYAMGISDSLKIGITEVMIASLGFILQFVYELLHKRK